jgi:hypothetical protein
MRELGFGLLLAFGLTLGCGKYGPPVRNLPPEPAPEATPAPGGATTEEAAPAEAPAESPAP